MTNFDGDDDHVHILFRATPTTDLVKFVNTVKGAIARRIRNEYADDLKTELWGDSFWNDSYCPISTGQVSLDVLKRHVENRREWSVITPTSTVSSRPTPIAKSWTATETSVGNCTTTRSTASTSTKTNTENYRP